MLGDWIINIPLRQWGGMLNVVAILVFMSVIISTVLLNVTPNHRAATPSA
jgi:hypothetical protein